MIDDNSSLKTLRISGSFVGDSTLILLLKFFALSLSSWLRLSNVFKTAGVKKAFPGSATVERTTGKSETTPENVVTYVSTSLR